VVKVQYLIISEVSGIRVTPYKLCKGINYSSKGKAIPLQALRVPGG
jgi:hypothetical protein